MDCVNHSGKTAAAYCQNCGKGLCVDCVSAGVLRSASSGQILCDTCIRAWQSAQAPFVPIASGGPNPTAAAILGVIPGVGAMYNGQFFKGFIHVVIFAVLISLCEHYGIFGLFIAAWVVYQSFEAYHTARARRDGDPIPDPLGLNEVGNWLNLGARPQPGQPNVNPGPYGAGQPQGGFPQGQYQAPNQAPFQVPYPQDPYTPQPPDTPIPPVPPTRWGHSQPIGAIVLIALGMLFLLNQLDIFHGRLMEFSWPLMLIALGVWLMIRRTQDGQGGPK